MIPDSLPPGLLAIEQELTARSRPEPSSELRSRVLAAVEHEIVGLRPTQLRGEFVRFAVTTAAAALLAINLSASLANDTNWRLRPAGPDVADLTDRIRELAPDFSEPEARRQALLLRTAARLTPAPDPAASRIPWNKDLNRWDTP